MDDPTLPPSPPSTGPPSTGPASTGPAAASGTPGPDREVPLTSAMRLKRHPYRGLLAAIPLAVGIVTILLVTKVIELSLTPIVVVVVATLLVGTLWGAFGPPSSPPNRTVGASRTSPLASGPPRTVIPDDKPMTDPRDWSPPTE